MKGEYMRAALRETEKAKKIDEVPIGCVIVKDDKIIAGSHDLRETKQQSINHAKIIATQKACKKAGSWRPEDYNLYVILEPCYMCVGAILQSRIRAVIYRIADLRGGSIESTLYMYEQPRYNHYPKVESGTLQNGCSQLLENLFKEERLEKK